MMWKASQRYGECWWNRISAPLRDEYGLSIYYGRDKKMVAK